MKPEKITFKQRIQTGLIFAVVGTIVVTIINYFMDLAFSYSNTTITFILFWVFGAFIAKKK